MENSKNGFILMGHGAQIFKDYLPTTLEDRALMKKIPYASMIRAIMYVMLCTMPNVKFSLRVMNKL